MNIMEITVGLPHLKSFILTQGMKYQSCDFQCAIKAIKGQMYSLDQWPLNPEHGLNICTGIPIQLCVWGMYTQRS